MLSYRHAFHAGNFADLIKHVVLVEILEHLVRKATPFEYIDTHAGAGLYDLHSAAALKLREYAGGIGRLQPQDYPEMARYFEVIQAFNAADELAFYPGSPAIAGYFLRPQDRAWLFELHPRDYELLRANLAGNRRMKVQCQDGFEGLQALLPPTSRRGLVLIDPSYEVKSDYDLVVDRLLAACRKFSHGIYALWYPVVERRRIDELETRIARSGIRNVQRFELGVAPDSAARGMTAAGMLVVNPPWKLLEKMAGLLPRLAPALAEEGGGSYKCEVLAGE
ncbi:MAG: 23S rRNA (adenine(2030)-N(6))-methyltransferase RlmJ [Pseudomonadales bacterium]|nr:23S rRNA (adenine(2030)-N(6))-methyltransferase RlmJ [Halieaceae bacterium]MCP5124001.1 23S rRNA (adenine(2030)-N(6))-methyltransferase RlmJ [Pseudomonadales bacterium]